MLWFVLAGALLAIAHLAAALTVATTRVATEIPDHAAPPHWLDPALAPNNRVIAFAPEITALHSG